MNIEEFKDYSYKVSGELRRQFPKVHEDWLIQRAMWMVYDKIKGEEDER